jgi:hypothetical protein
MAQVDQRPLIQAPYEAAIVAICSVIEKAMDGQTPEQRAALWRMTIENLRFGHEFWKSVGEFFKPKN